MLAPQGILYTRLGSFLVNNDNRLSLPDGNLLLDRGGQEITLPDGWEQITISPEGIVFADNDRIAQLSVVDFADDAALEKLDSLYYRAAPELEPVITEEAQILQGARELSNVEPVRELVQLINVERNYRHIANYLNLEDERALEAIRNLTR